MIIGYVVLSLAICLCFFGIVAAFDKMRIMNDTIEIYKIRLDCMDRDILINSKIIDLLYAVKYDDVTHEIRH